MKKFFVVILVIVLLLASSFFFFNSEAGQQLIHRFIPSIDTFSEHDSPANTHDMVLEDNGSMGYTAIDFEEAILGRAEKKEDLIVLERNVSEVVTATDTGLFNLSVFTKCQAVKYFGTADYILKLNSLKPTDIFLDQNTKTVFIHIPSAFFHNIAIDPNKTEVLDNQNGFLSVGKTKFSFEEINKIQKSAVHNMKEALHEDGTLNIANTLAKESVRDIYAPIITSSFPGYHVEIIGHDEEFPPLKPDTDS